MPMGKMPLIGFSLPSKESSEAKRNPSVLKSTPRDRAARPIAMGRSNPEPVFLISAGARLIVIFFGGSFIPLLDRVCIALSLLSFAAPCARPIILIDGMPRVASTSMSISVASMPSIEALLTLLNIYFTVIFTSGEGGDS